MLLKAREKGNARDGFKRREANSLLESGSAHASALVHISASGRIFGLALHARSRLVTHHAKARYLCRMNHELPGNS